MRIPTTQAELKSCLEQEPRLKRLSTSLAKLPGDGDAAHDRSHVLRVALSTCQILGEPESCAEAIASALLHDLVNVPKNHPDRARASELSAEAARPLLTEAGFAANSIDRIATAIRQHSFSRGEKPTEALAMALQDADRLEALGAIGIMRVFSTGARMGTAYFHADDPWAKNRSLDDSRFSVDHFFTKLLALPATMNTERGRAEAQARARALEDFLANLEHELGEPRTKKGE